MRNLFKIALWALAIPAALLGQASEPSFSVNAPTNHQVLAYNSSTGFFSNFSLSALGNGTVTQVSGVSANGISWTIGTPTTTPTLRIALGAITPISVNGLIISTTNAILTIASGKSFTDLNNITFAGVDGSTLTFQATGVVVNRDSTDTLTNKIYDTAGTGNVFEINGAQVSDLVGGSLAVASGHLTFSNDASAPGNHYVYSTDGSGIKGWHPEGGETVTSIAGTANQVTSSAAVGAVVLSIPSDFRPPGTVNGLTLASQTSGFTIAGGTSSKTLTVAANVNTGTVDGTLGANAFTSTPDVPQTRLVSTTAPLTGGGDLSANRTIAIPVATSVANGYLSSADWSTFNGKQASGSYITALTGDVSASGPGSSSSTVSKIGGQSISLAGSLATSGAFASTLTFTGNTNVTFPTSGTLSTTTGTVTAVSVATANGFSGSSSGGATPALTIVAGAITPASVNGLTLTASATGFTIAGGTSSKTATIAGNFATSHGDDLTLTTTGNTNVTFPTSGTLATTAGTVSSITGTSGQITASSPTGSVTLSIPASVFGPTSVGINTGSTPAVAALQVVDTATTSPRGITDDQYNTGTNSAQFNARKARGTFATPTTIVSGDIMGRYLAWGHDGTNFIESGNLRFTSAGTIATNRVPSQAEVWTSTDAAPSVLTRAVYWDAAQNEHVIGTVSASNLSLGGTLTTAGATTMSGAFSFIGTLTGNTSVTFPTSGTLSTSTGTVTSIVAGTGLSGGTITSTGTIAVLTSQNIATLSNLSTNGFVTTTGGVGTLTITNAAAFTSGTLSDVTAFGLRDTSAAFDLTLAGTSSTALTAGRTLTFDVVNASRTLKLTGNAVLNQDVSTAGSPQFGGTITVNGAGNGVVVAGTGNSRTLALQSTTSGGTATTFLTGNADQSVTTASGLAIAGAFSGATTIAASGLSTLSGGVLVTNASNNFRVTSAVTSVGISTLSPGGWLSLQESSTPKWSIYPRVTGEFALYSETLSADVLRVTGSTGAFAFQSVPVSGITTLGTNSITSAASSTLTLGTGTFGTAVTFASATGIPTFATAVVFSGNLTFGTSASILNGTTGSIGLTATGTNQSITLTPTGSGSVYGPTGTNSNPGYAFAAHTNSGVYSDASGNIDISVAGNQVATLQATVVNFAQKITTNDTSDQSGVGTSAIQSPGGGAFAKSVYIGTINSVSGPAIIRNAGRATAQVAANASVATYTVGASDASFEVSANVLVTTATTASFTVTCAYTDESNVARTLTLSFSSLAGTFLTTITNVTGTGPYEGVPMHIRCKASTAITIATTGTFTSVTYNVQGAIVQLN